MAGFSKREALRAASEASWLLASAIWDLQQAVKELLEVDVDSVGWEDWERITQAVNTAETMIAHALEEIGIVKRQLEQLRKLINERNLAEARAETVGRIVSRHAGEG
jgi:serine phosphatase RsbU (regulator of sigma subunit)